MRHVDFTPFYRSTVGFDRLFDLLGSGSEADAAVYPPYNIERLSDNEYRITMRPRRFMNQTILCCADWGQITVSYTVLPLSLTRSAGYSTNASCVRKTQADQRYHPRVADSTAGRNRPSPVRLQEVFHVGRDHLP